MTRPVRPLEAMLVALVAVLFTVLASILPVAAETAPQKGEKGLESATSPASQTQEDWRKELTVTRHELNTPGGVLRYTATAGEMLAPPAEEDAPEQAQARIFFVAYEVEGQEERERPITFAFNGGPGASSVWLHMGALGPVRVSLGPEAELRGPPFGYEANPLSWLEFTDLVFVDPVGTGYSRSVPQKQGEQQKPAGTQKSFWGVQQDVESLGSFIRLWLTRKQRWLSPTYLVGESYGATRAAALSSRLLTAEGVALDGLVLVSPVIDFSTLFSSGSNLPYTLALPSYAATARLHGKLGTLGGEFSANDPEAFQPAVERWVEDVYVRGLFLGDAMEPSERDEFYATVATLSGLSVSVVRNHFARIEPYVFFKELLREERQIVGRMDGSITAMDNAPESPFPDFDPSLDSLEAPFATAFNAYVRSDLGYESDLPYEVLNPTVGQKWDWKSGLHGDQGYVDVSDELAEAMSINPAMRVWLACGYYDLATPYFASIYTVRQMQLATAVRENLQVRLYRGGHMLYTHEQARKKLRDDAADFYAPRKSW